MKAAPRGSARARTWRSGRTARGPYTPTRVWGSTSAPLGGAWDVRNTSDDDRGDRDERLRPGSPAAAFCALAPVVRAPSIWEHGLSTQRSRYLDLALGSRDIGSVVAGGTGLACMVARMERDRPEDEKLEEAVEEMRSDAEEMQERSEELGESIETTRSDWRSKQQDEAVPGAQPPLDNEAEHPPRKPA